MKVDLKTIEHLAHLSKLEFSDSEKQNMLDDFDKMLGFVGKLDELDIQDIQPKIYVNDEFDRMREDVPEHNYSRKAVLDNAPQKDSYYFRVPKVLKN